MIIVNSTLRSDRKGEMGVMEMVAEKSGWKGGVRGEKHLIHNIEWQPNAIKTSTAAMLNFAWGRDLEVGGG
jgi:hypothetical protein